LPSRQLGLFASYFSSHIGDTALDPLGRLYKSGSCRRDLVLKLIDFLVFVCLDVRLDSACFENEAHLSFLNDGALPLEFFGRSSDFFLLLSVLGNLLPYLVIDPLCLCDLWCIFLVLCPMSSANITPKYMSTHLTSAISASILATSFLSLFVLLISTTLLEAEASPTFQSDYRRYVAVPA
jgi:hypothetical protein